MPSSQSLPLFLSLMLIMGLVGCGPASSDKASNLESGASVGGPGAQGMGQGGKQFIPPSASKDGTGSTSGRVLIPERDNLGQGSGLPSRPAGTPNLESDGNDKLPVTGIPDSIAKGLDSPDARERLRALNHWGEKGIKAPLDPLFEALEDEDDAVRAKATAIIEQQWTIEREREERG